MNKELTDKLKHKNEARLEETTTWEEHRNTVGFNAPSANLQLTPS